MHISLPRAHQVHFESLTSTRLESDVFAVLDENYCAAPPRMSCTLPSADSQNMRRGALQAQRGIVRWQVADKGGQATADITARLERVYYDNLGLRLHLTGLQYDGPSDPSRCAQLLTATVATGLAFGKRQQCYQLMGDCKEKHVTAFEAVGFKRVGVSLRRIFEGPSANEGIDIDALEHLLQKSDIGLRCHQRGLDAGVARSKSAHRFIDLAGAPQDRQEAVGAMVDQQASLEQFTILLTDKPSADVVAMAKVFIERHRFIDGEHQALLTGVAVAPNRRRQGIGALISLAATEAARLAGVRSISLDCFAKDDPGEEAFHELLYTNLGYRRDGVWMGVPGVFPEAENA